MISYVLFFIDILSLQLCREIDQDQLLNLYRQESDFLDAGCLLFAQSFEREVMMWLSECSD